MLIVIAGAIALFAAVYFGIPAYREHRQKQREWDEWYAMVGRLDAQSGKDKKIATPAPH